MDDFLRSLTDGNVLLKIFILQFSVGVLVVFLLKKAMDRELFLAALERITALPDGGDDAAEVIVVAAGRLLAQDEARLRSVIKGRFPRSEIVVGYNGALWGGIVVRIAGCVLDLSLCTKIKHLWSRPGR